jgi:hypothetical protein
MRALWLFTASALLLPIAARAQFSLDMDQPPFRVQIPSIPAIKMSAHPMQAKGAHLRLHGVQEPYAVSVLTPTADAGMSAADCAGTLTRLLPKRPGVPAQDKIRKGRIDANTFIALYASPLPGAVQMHAHLFSAAGGTHCVEVHATKVATSEEDAERWFRGFANAKIEPR